MSILIRRLYVPLAVFLAAALLTAVPAFAGDGLTVRHDGIIESYGSNTLLVDAPAAGSLTVTVRDDYSLFRTLRQEVPAGESALRWDGLRDDGQRLGIYNGIYTLEAVLVCPDGASYTAAAQAEGRSRQALLYALPSAGVLYQDGGRWFAEVGTVKPGAVVMTVAAAQAPDEALVTRRRVLGEKGVGRLNWNGTANGKKVPEGRYLLCCWAEENPDIRITLEITVAEGAPQAAAVTPTGPVMPETGADDSRRKRSTKDRKRRRTDRRIPFAHRKARPRVWYSDSRPCFSDSSGPAFTAGRWHLSDILPRRFRNQRTHPG